MPGWTQRCFLCSFGTQAGPRLLEGGAVAGRLLRSLGGWPRVLARCRAPPSWHRRWESGSGTHSDLTAFLTSPFSKHGLTLALSRFP